MSVPTIRAAISIFWGVVWGMIVGGWIAHGEAGMARPIPALVLGMISMLAAFFAGTICHGAWIFVEIALDERTLHPGRILGKSINKAGMAPFSAIFFALALLAGICWLAGAIMLGVMA